MSDTKGPANDPSMDDILASIRKIISDDEARAQGQAAAPSPESASVSPPTGTRDEVLLLTDLVDEPKAAASAGSQPSAPPVGPLKQSAASSSLVEPGAAGLAASAFDRLSHAVQEATPQPVASDPGPSVGPNGRNLEDIVKELLRPMLKEWLDKNLPPMVERFVEREIVRLTRR